jgi:hypothetical protein
MSQSSGSDSFCLVFQFFSTLLRKILSEKKLTKKEIVSPRVEVIFLDLVFSFYFFSRAFPV